MLKAHMITGPTCLVLCLFAASIGLHVMPCSAVVVSNADLKAAFLSKERAGKLFGAKQWEHALNLYKQAIAQLKGVDGQKELEATLYSNIAQCYHEMKQPEEAKVAAQMALSFQVLKGDLLAKTHYRKGLALVKVCLTSPGQEPDDVLKQAVEQFDKCKAKAANKDWKEKCHKVEFAVITTVRQLMKMAAETSNDKSVKDQIIEPERLSLKFVEMTPLLEKRQLGRVVHTEKTTTTGSRLKVIVEDFLHEQEEFFFDRSDITLQSTIPPTAGQIGAPVKDDQQIGQVLGIKADKDALEEEGRFHLVTGLLGQLGQQQLASDVVKPVRPERPTHELVATLKGRVWIEVTFGMNGAKTFFVPARPEDTIDNVKERLALEMTKGEREQVNNRFQSEATPGKTVVMPKIVLDEQTKTVKTMLVKPEDVMVRTVDPANLDAMYRMRGRWEKLDDYQSVSDLPCAEERILGSLMICKITVNPKMRSGRL